MELYRKVRLAFREGMSKRAAGRQASSERLYPMLSGYHIEALFGDGHMVGKIPHQVSRSGYQWTGPIYVATEVFLFVGRKRPPG